MSVHELVGKGEVAQGGAMARAVPVPRARTRRVPGAHTSPGASRSRRRTTILVVDDDDDSRAIVRKTLEAKAYRVIEASGGAEAADMFERERADCVLLDVRMADLDGFATCERIRASRRGRDTTVLFLTAHNDPDTFERALRAGGDDFIAKPIFSDELLVRVETARKLRQIRQPAPGSTSS